MSLQVKHIVNGNVLFFHIPGKIAAALQGQCSWIKIKIQQRIAKGCHQQGDEQYLLTPLIDAYGDDDHHNGNTYCFQYTVRRKNICIQKASYYEQGSEGNVLKDADQSHS